MASTKAPRVAVEWVYVRYSTIAGIVLALAALGAGGAWYWWSGRAPSPEERATAAIETAESTIVEARTVVPDAPAILTARDHLMQARESFAAADFPVAEDEAVTATSLAREAIEQKHGSAEVGVRIGRVEGDVRVKRAGQFLWEAASERTILHSGDQVRSGTSGTAQLVYFDGTLTTLSPGSLLEIRELFRDPAMRRQRVKDHLAWGTLRASTQQAEGVESIHEVGTKSASVVTKSASEFQVSHDEDRGHSEVVAMQGDLTLRTERGEVPVRENTRVSLDPAGTVVETSALLDYPRPVAPPDQRSFLAPNESIVRLSWQSVETAQAYHVQLSERPLFTSVVNEQERLARTSIDLAPLGPGSYYWRVAAVDEKGHRGRWSEVRSFRVVGAEFRDSGDTTPPALNVAEILVVGTNAIVSGSTEAGSLVWIDGERIDVEDDGQFTWVIKLHQDGRNKIQFMAQDAAGNEIRRVGYAHVDGF